jgi:chromosome segregation ATPase
VGDKRKMKRLTNAEKAELHKKLEEAEKAKFKPYENKIAELEKENAELRKDKKELCHSISEGGKACVYLNEQLTKAKEIIKKLIEAIHIWDCKNLEEVEAEAEQFLNSEVEKNDRTEKTS